MTPMNIKTTNLPTTEDRLAAIEERLERGSERMELMENELRVNTADGRTNNAMTAELLDLFQTAKGGFKVLGGLGFLFKWVGIFAGSAVSIYTALYAITHGGTTPK